MGISTSSTRTFNFDHCKLNLVKDYFSKTNTAMQTKDYETKKICTPNLHTKTKCPYELNQVRLTLHTMNKKPLDWLHQAKWKKMNLSINELQQALHHHPHPTL